MERIESKAQSKSVTIMTATADVIAHTYALVAGVYFENRDGSSRQRFIRQCRPGEQVFLRIGSETSVA